MDCSLPALRFVRLLLFIFLFLSLPSSSFLWSQKIFPFRCCALYSAPHRSGLGADIDIVSAVAFFTASSAFAAGGCLLSRVRPRNKAKAPPFQLLPLFLSRTAFASSPGRPSCISSCSCQYSTAHCLRASSQNGTQQLIQSSNQTLPNLT